MGKIFLDLDGPVLDNKVKHYSIYKSLLCDGKHPLLPEDKYWDAKRNKVPERKILEGVISPEEIQRYEQQRLDAIELFDFLKMDTLQPGIIDTLSCWAASHDIFLVTLRRKRESLARQLRHLGLTPLFKKILNENDNSGVWQVKEKLIREEITRPEECVMIGDTEVDIATGKHFGITTIAITNGIRSHEFLAALEPDYLFEYIKDIQIDSILS